MIEQQLRQLAARKDSAAPFLSLYIDTHRNDESQRDRVRVLLKDEMRQLREALKGNGHDQQIENGIRQIEQYIANSLHAGTRGVAIFACPTEDFFVPIQLPMRVEPTLRIGSRPHLRPLAVLQQAFPRVALAMVDGKSARLFELEFGSILNEIDLDNPDMPRRHDQGGWSQSNLQRHLQDHIDRHHKEVAEILTRMADQGRVNSIVLSGQDRNVANFRTFLSKRVEERILGTLHLDMGAPADEILAGCQQILDAHRIAAIGERLRNVVSAGTRQGRAALGFDAVVDAANQRKIEQLFLRTDVECRGWRCNSCGILGRAVPLGCPVCNGTVSAVDLVEELIAANEGENSRVSFVNGASELDSHDGVAALLRF